MHATHTERRLAYLPALLLVILYVLLVLRTAWLCDDAYILFRTLDNAVHGLGLTWNPGERVQAYTSPLWLLTLLPFYAVTGEAYYTVTLLSIVLSLAAMLLLVQRLAPGPASAMLAAGTLALSKAYMDYSTSGLENPLLHLLLVAFFIVLLKDATGGRLLALTFIAALVLLTRLDLALLVAPPLLWFIRQHLSTTGGWRALPRLAGRIALGLAPLIAWELFSLVYYGFPFPNTAYAKLNTGLPAGQLAGRGLQYLWRCLYEDPLTVTALAAALALPWMLAGGARRAIAIGVLLQMLYLVRIGGDFMLGRFLTPPLVAAVVVLACHRALSFRIATPALLVVAILGFQSPYAAMVTDADFSRPAIGAFGVADERGFYYPYTGLSRTMRSVPVPHHPHIDAGRALRRWGPCVAVYVNTGFHGYYAGPQCYIVDPFALSDPLLARLPPVVDRHWRIGHLPRHLPAGYLESIETGRNRITDPALAAFYDKLLRITRGPLFTWPRWRAIWDLNVTPVYHPPSNN